MFFEERRFRQDEDAEFGLVLELCPRRSGVSTTPVILPPAIQVRRQQVHHLATFRRLRREVAGHLNAAASST